MTGFQVGYAIDDAPIEWLPSVRGSEETFEVPVPDEAVETEVKRWSFYFRHTVERAPTDCYVGGGSGAPYWRIEALATAS